MGLDWRRDTIGATCVDDWSTEGPGLTRPLFFAFVRCLYILCGMIQLRVQMKSIFDVCTAESLDHAKERFWRLVDRVDSGCLEWRAARMGAGYGEFSYGGQNFRAHRVSWEFVYGRLPRGAHVMHLCDNRPCCNPEHLALGTHTDNMWDMQAKGRANHPTGENAGPFVLTQVKVDEIRRMASDGVVCQQALADLVGVHKSTVGRILRNDTWPDPRWDPVKYRVTRVKVVGESVGVWHEDARREYSLGKRDSRGGFVSNSGESMVGVAARIGTNQGNLSGFLTRTFGKASALTEQVRGRLRELGESGVTGREAAKETGLHYASVAREWRKMGIKRLGGSTKVTPEVLEQMAEMYQPEWGNDGRLRSKVGVGTTVVGKVFDVDQTRVSVLMRKWLVGRV